MGETLSEISGCQLPMGQKEAGSIAHRRGCALLD